MKNARYNTETLPIRTEQTNQMAKILRKPWVKAFTQPNWITQKRVNSNLENAFHRIIDAVKTHHLQPGEIYFERDYKTDPMVYFPMHCLMTANFYICLECELALNYLVEYDFYNCQYKDPVMLLLAQYPMDIRGKGINLQPDFPAFYKNTLAYQPQQFIHSFKS